MRTLSLLLLALAGCPDTGGKDSVPTESLPTGEIDEDGDGVYAVVDCDDSNADVFPGADEICDGVDNDCDSEVDGAAAIDAVTSYADTDADGFGDTNSSVSDCGVPEGYAAEGGDCDDADAAYNPDAAEADCTDPNDYNCDGSVGYADADADGTAACEDCDDADAGVRPGAAELCDGVDQDCDGETDEDAADGTTWYADADADGFGDSTLTLVACELPAGYAATGDDCNDADAAYNPGAVESDCADPNDYNCDGSSGATDADGDGYAACEECDDGDAAINPGAAEACDLIDNNCDGSVDEGTSGATIWYADADADGYGDPAVTSEACSAPAGYVATGDDCNDADAAYNPGVIESDCTDPNDYNCDGASGAVDTDGDGFVACEDCDDTDAAVSPNGVETCDGIDNNCDGATDEDTAVDAATWYVDADLDGYGLDSAMVVACSVGLGYSSVAGDCDDGNLNANPAGEEVCDAADNNCDGAVDEGVGATWYADADADGYGDPATFSDSCDAPVGFVADNTDCDDTVDFAYPGAEERCDSFDNDCDGATDEEDAVDPTTSYADADADGYGDPATTVTACDVPVGYTFDNTDCDDTADTSFPGADEYCNGTDDNCDGTVDEDAALDASPWYLDNDADGYGDVAVATVSCAAPDGYVGDDTDCDDNADTVNPGATELCDIDNVDENCNGAADDDDGAVDIGTYSTFYADLDVDTYGDAAVSITQCDLPDGYVLDSADCDDTRADVNPDAVEVCDALNTDDDCNGLADDDDGAAELTATGFTFYDDNDGDGFGDVSDSAYTCDAPDGYVTDDTDCDDSRGDINPAGEEVCDTLDADEDCNGVADDDDLTVDHLTRDTFYTDADEDGYGDPGASIRACDLPDGAVEDDSDCDDTNVDVNPSAIEICDAGSVDEDCNGAADDDDATVDASTYATFFADNDADLFGDPAGSVSVCDQPDGYVPEAERTDCDDSDPTVNPDAIEVCDSLDLDEDCNGAADDLDGAVDTASRTTFYADLDADAFGDASVMVQRCDPEEGEVEDNTDCDDTDALVNPDGTEVCDDLDADEDCDGATDDNDAAHPGSVNSFYYDVDEDGYGDPAVTIRACDADPGQIDNNDDCDDSVDTVYPGAPEVCENGVDESCDGVDDCEWIGAYVAATDADETFVGVPGYTASTYPAGFFGGVAIGGDVTGDGLSDIIAADRGWDFSAGTQNIGRVYVLAGAAGGVTATTASPSATITGATGSSDAGDAFGQGLAVLSDIDGDDDGELIVGQYKDNGASTDAGRAYLFLGGATLSGAVGQTSASLFVTGSAGSSSAYPELTGWSVASVGDIDGDNVDDWAVGAPGYGGSGAAARSGRVAIVPGDLTPSTTGYGLAHPSMISTITGAVGEIAGATVGGADVDGNGTIDTLVQAVGVSTSPIYVFLDGAVGTLTTSSADYSLTGATQVYTASSTALDLNNARAVVDAGDTDGDGYTDLWIGADGTDTAASDAGAAYLLNGPVTTSGSVVTEADFVIRGIFAQDYMGRSVGAAGDVDADGNADLLVGASAYDLGALSGGAAVLVYGPATGTATLASTNVAVYLGNVASGNAGAWVDGVGDVDGDNFDDFILAAPNATSSSYGTTKVGAVYLYYGTAE